jgi:hypothetical protein
MKGLKGIIVISTIVAAAAALSACDRAYKDASMKRGTDWRCCDAGRRALSTAVMGRQGERATG